MTLIAMYLWLSILCALVWCYLECGDSNWGYDFTLGTDGMPRATDKAWVGAKVPKRKLLITTLPDRMTIGFVAESVQMYQSARSWSPPCQTEGPLHWCPSRCKCIHGHAPDHHPAKQKGHWIDTWVGANTNAYAPNHHLARQSSLDYWSFLSWLRSDGTTKDKATIPG